MKRFLIVLGEAFICYLLTGIISERASAKLKIPEDSTAYTCPPNNPDPNNSFLFGIDLFTCDPTGRWIKKAGNGSFSWIGPPNCLHTVDSTGGITYRLQYPNDTLSFLSYKNIITFSVKSTSKFAVETRIKVKTPGDTVKYKVIRYLPEDSSNYSVGDTLVVPIGSRYKNGSFQVINRNLESSLHLFFPTYSFQMLTHASVRGTVDVCAVAAWSRYFYIEGYSDSTSIRQGSDIHFMVSLGDSAASTSYKIEIYRAGADSLWKVASSGTLTGVKRPVRSDTLADSVFYYGTDWPSDYTFSGSTTAGWKSGIYLAKFGLLSNGQYSWFPFVVRQANPGSTSKILVQISNTTYQAYNCWGGESFYYPTGMGMGKSFNRPYLENWFNPEHKNVYALGEVIPGTTSIGDSLGAGYFFAWEYPFVNWLERQGYVAEYTDQVNIYRDFKFSENFLKKYNSLFSLGHDEYWSREMRRNVEFEFRNKSFPKITDTTARATHNVAFLSGNCIFWLINFTASNRIFNDRNDTMSYHAQQVGVRRPDDTSRIWYEQELVGSRSSNGFIATGKADTVSSYGAGHWTFRGTGLAVADSFGWKNSYHPYGISGYETQVIAKSTETCSDDHQDDPPDGLSIGDIKLLAGASLAGQGGCKSQVTYYDYAKDTTLSKVFGAGAIQWNWGLDNSSDPIRRITKNVVDGLSPTFVGDIAQNMTWSRQIYLGGDVTVDSGVTVTINPGTKIYFFPNNDVQGTGDATRTELIVKGTLIAMGSLDADSIIFTSASTSPAAGDWGGISFTGIGKGNFDYCRVSYANTAISAQGDSVKVRDCTFNYFKSNAFYVTAAKLDLGKVVLLPCCCGLNNIFMNTASSGAKAVNNAGSGGIYAQGNWWDAAPPTSSWFVGTVNKTHYLYGPATPDSCGNTMRPQPKVAANLPTKFGLSQNYPNPFNPTTTIRYALPKAANVELRIFNILGQEVRLLVDQEQAPGYYQIPWDGKDQKGRSVSTGIYLYQIRAGDFIETKKMQLIK